MKILYKSSEIRKTIVSLFRKSKGRRVVISAFVGQGAEDYLPNPKGIELICWPKAGSTNPHTIRILIQRGVSVFFGDQVHTKLYWTSDIGAVVTSANLSTNALGSGGLIEFGILVQSKDINIKNVIGEIELQDITKDPRNQLETLDKLHKEYIKQNPKENLRLVKSRDFIEWYQSPAREEWKTAIVEYTDLKLAPTVKSMLQNEYGKNKPYDFMSANSKEYSENDWIMILHETTRKNKIAISDISWMYADRVEKVSKQERNSINDGLDMQVLQISPLRNYEQPPFSIRNTRIRNAIKNAYIEMYSKRSPNSVVPSKKFIDIIKKHYS